ncbi:hypothetical protein RIF29_38017 [Crotalaria pallida]|uniref:Peptidase A1 domain-containing protein n=1 Tax=Crotalaria pallida TaxID=3830 RepID=A0AAN9HNI5_CROPI
MENIGGEIVFGVVGLRHFRGDRTFVPLSRKGYWQIEFGDVLLGNSSTENFATTLTGVCDGGCAAVVDTGTSLITGPIVRPNPVGQSFIDCSSIAAMPQLSLWNRENLAVIMLLEMLMNNIGKHIHEQVIDTGIIPILVKIVKKKSDLPVRERIFLLLDATQTSLGGASGKFPKYYNAYYDLVVVSCEIKERIKNTKKARINYCALPSSPNSRKMQAEIGFS